MNSIRKSIQYLRPSKYTLKKVMWAVNRLFLTLAVLLILANRLWSERLSDPVFAAMQDEITRSMEELTMPGMPTPYFMSYQVRDYNTTFIEAHFDAIVKSESSHERVLYTEMRVGDPLFDNTGYYGSWSDIQNNRERMVEEDNYRALRQQLWLSTDRAYKVALERFANKKSYIQVHPDKDTIADFSPEERFSMMEELVPSKMDSTFWTNTVGKVGKTLKVFPTLQDWNVKFKAVTLIRRFLNSEESIFLTKEDYCELEISATTQTMDGNRVSNFMCFIIPDRGIKPDVDEILHDVKKMASELVTMSNAKMLTDDYCGPIVFSDYAAAQFISQLFANQLVLSRKPLVADEWLAQNLSLGKLSGKLEKRIMPSFISITDEPSRQYWEGERLLGYLNVDDEGIKSRNIKLVDCGRLVNLPMTRQPLKKLSGSNGHAILLPFQVKLPRITNLVVSSSESKSTKELMEQMRQSCREQDIEFGLLIKSLDEPRISSQYSFRTFEDSDEKTLLTVPIVAYKVFAEDGRLEPVRGLQFENINAGLLRDIILLGDDERVHNIHQPTINNDVQYLVSIITPSILIEEMELKSGSIPEPMPVVSNPFFNDKR